LRGYAILPSGSIKNVDQKGGFAKAQKMILEAKKKLFNTIEWVEAGFLRQAQDKLTPIVGNARK